MYAIIDWHYVANTYDHVASDERVLDVYGAEIRQ